MAFKEFRETTDTYSMSDYRINLVDALVKEILKGIQPVIIAEYLSNHAEDSFSAVKKATKYLHLLYINSQNDVPINSIRVCINFLIETACRELKLEYVDKPLILHMLGHAMNWVKSFAFHITHYDIQSRSDSYEFITQSIEEINNLIGVLNHHDSIYITQIQYRELYARIFSLPLKYFGTENSYLFDLFLYRGGNYSLDELFTTMDDGNEMVNHSISKQIHDEPSTYYVYSQELSSDLDEIYRILKEIRWFYSGRDLTPEEIMYRYVKNYNNTELIGVFTLMYITWVESTDSNINKELTHSIRSFLYSLELVIVFYINGIIANQGRKVKASYNIINKFYLHELNRLINATEYLDRSDLFTIRGFKVLFDGYLDFVVSIDSGVHPENIEMFKNDVEKVVGMLTTATKIKRKKQGNGKKRKSKQKR